MNATTPSNIDVGSGDNSEQNSNSENDDSPKDNKYHPYPETKPSEGSKKRTIRRKPNYYIPSREELESCANLSASQAAKKLHMSKTKIINLRRKLREEMERGGPQLSAQTNMPNQTQISQPFPTSVTPPISSQNVRTAQNFIPQFPNQNPTPVSFEQQVAPYNGYNHSYTQSLQPMQSNVPFFNDMMQSQETGYPYPFQEPTLQSQQQFGVFDANEIKPINNSQFNMAGVEASVDDNNNNLASWCADQSQRQSQWQRQRQIQMQSQNLFNVDAPEDFKGANPKIPTPKGPNSPYGVPTNPIKGSSPTMHSGLPTSTSPMLLPPLNPNYQRIPSNFDSVAPLAASSTSYVQNSHQLLPFDDAQAQASENQQPLPGISELLSSKGQILNTVPRSWFENIKPQQ